MSSSSHASEMYNHGVFSDKRKGGGMERDQGIPAGASDDNETLENMSTTSSVSDIQSVDGKKLLL